MSYKDDVVKRRAMSEHPVGARLAQQGQFDQRNVSAFYKALGETPPLAGRFVGRLVRKTQFTLHEVGEVFQPMPTNYPDRAPWLYRLLDRSLSETFEQELLYAAGWTQPLTEAEINRLQPQAIGSPPYHDNDLKLPDRLLALFRGYKRSLD